MAFDIDLELSPQDLAFQAEVREFYAANLTPELRKAASLTTWAFAEFDYGRQWQQILHRRGWGAPEWPVEYGGAGWTPSQHLIWELEAARARPPKIMTMGRKLAAPCIMRFGTEEQKAYFLPRIISGEDWWAQGYSEPGAGSDLASVQLSAVPDGDDYVLNGSKIWTTFAHRANRIFVLARSSQGERKHDGITFLMVDMDTPGIDVRPIINIAGEHEFNQVFFTDVRAPQSRRLGPEGGGWAVARHLLLFEHGATILRNASEMHWRVGWVTELAGLEGDGFGGTLLDDPDFSRQLALLDIGVQASEFACAQLIASEQHGDTPGPHAELLSVRTRELGQALTELGMEAVGYYAGPDQRAARVVDSGVGPIGPEHTLLPTPFYLAQRAATIAGGTAEIHRNNLAKRLLGL